MRYWLLPSSYNVVVLFLAMCVFGILFAWNSVNLVQMAMGNIRFLNTHGSLAIREGGLIQLMEITAYGFISLAAYLGFKTCEVELVSRWRSARDES